MATMTDKEKIHQQIDQLNPEQINLLANFIDFLHYKGNLSTPSQPQNSEDLAPQIEPAIDADIKPDIKDSLPDCFWLGEE